MKPVKMCSAPGCRVIVPLGQKYCQKHQQAAAAYVAKHYGKDTKQGHEANHERYQRRMYHSDESKAQQFYHSRQWRKLSHRWLVDHPLCAECQRHGIVKQADLVDHITPVRVDWSKRFDTSNLQSLCYACHNRKSKHEKYIRETQKNNFGK